MKIFVKFLSVEVCEEDVWEKISVKPMKKTNTGFFTIDVDVANEVEIIKALNPTLKNINFSKQSKDFYSYRKDGKTVITNKHEDYYVYTNFYFKFFTLSDIKTGTSIVTNITKKRNGKLIRDYDYIPQMILIKDDLVDNKEELLNSLLKEEILDVLSEDSTLKDGENNEVIVEPNSVYSIHIANYLQIL